MTGPSAIPTPATPDVCSIAVLIDGEEISGAFHIMAVSTTTELNRIPHAQIELRDGEASQATFTASDTEHFIPGRQVEIRLGYRGLVDSVFSGVIIKQRIKIRKSVSTLVVECRDAAVRMTTGLNSRYYVDQPDNDIIEDLVTRHGLHAHVEATKVVLKEVVQYESTDWDFLLCRAEANAKVVVVHNGTVTVAAPDTTTEPIVTATFGATVLELDAEIDARRQPVGVKTVSWNGNEQELLEAEAAEPAVTTNGNIPSHELAQVIGRTTDVWRHGGNLSEPELQAWADARLLKDRMSKIRGRVRFQGFAGARPGTVLSTLGIGARFAGPQYVSGVRHTVVNGNWETDVQFGLSPEPAAATYRVSSIAAGGLVPSVSGLQIGIVTALQGDPDDADRIKVRLPLVSTSDEGIWARLATLDAGASRGTFFRPEINDEVVVGFLSSDPRCPVVLGMCHSSAKPNPEPARDENNVKGYVSRSKLRLRFDDELKEVLIETPAGNRLVLSEDGRHITIRDQNGGSVSMNEKGITVSSATDLTLQAEKDIHISGNNIDLKGLTFKVDGGSSAEVSSASTKIQGSATTMITGAMVHIN